MTTITRRDSQDSVLGLISFLLYVNSIAEEVQNLLSKLSDDTKILRPITVENDHQILQKGLDILRLVVSEMKNEI